MNRWWCRGSPRQSSAFRLERIRAINARVHVGTPIFEDVVTEEFPGAGLEDSLFHLDVRAYEAFLSTSIRKDPTEWIDDSRVAVVLDAADVRHPNHVRCHDVALVLPRPSSREH